MYPGGEYRTSTGEPAEWISQGEPSLGQDWWWVPVPLLYGLDSPHVVKNSSMVSPFPDSHHWIIGVGLLTQGSPELFTRSLPLTTHMQPRVDWTPVQE